MLFIVKKDNIVIYEVNEGKNMNTNLNKILLILLFLLISGCNKSSERGEVINSEEYKYIENTNTTTTYNYCQSLKWLDEYRFAIGRFDGTLSIFDIRDKDNGFTASQVLLNEDHSQITTIEPTKHNMTFISNGKGSINLLSYDGSSYYWANRLDFDLSFGEFNSGCEINFNDEDYFVSGHENGYIVIWKWDGEKYIEDGYMDIRSKNPIEAEFMIKNIRGVKPYKDATVITACEDGDLALIDIVKKEEIFRMRYRKDAKLGMNGLSISGEYLLSSNCTNGNEPNLNLYRLKDNKIIPLDNIYLAKDKDRKNIYGVTIDFYENRFTISTSEYYIWFGEVVDDELKVNEYYGNGEYKSSSVFDYSFDRKMIASSLNEIELIELN